MTKEELVGRIEAATEAIEIDSEALDIIEESDAALSDYWAGSASASYCRHVRTGNVKQAWRHRAREMVSRDE